MMKKVVSYKMTKAFSKFEKAQNVLNGREQPTVLELYNFILDTSDHYSNLRDELEAIRRYEPKDEALVML